MADDFGLGDLLDEVKNVGVDAVPSGMRVVGDADFKNVAAGEAFKLEYELINARGATVPAPSGSALDVELKLENITDTGRLQGVPKLQDSGAWSGDVVITAEGRYTIDARVTLGDRVTRFNCAANVSVSAGDAAMAAEASESESWGGVEEAEKEKGKEKEKRKQSRSSASSSSPSGSGSRRKRRRSGSASSDSSSSSSSSSGSGDESSSQEWEDVDAVILSPLYKPKEKVTAYEFTYKSDYDKRGVMYYFGLNRHRSKRWRNPADIGYVDVISSSVRKGEPSSFVAKRPEQLGLCTQDEPLSWIGVDLKNFVCAPHTYTLSNRCDKLSRDVLTNWTLEGSVDKRLWVVLSHHKDDLSLQKARLDDKKSHTFTIPQCKYYFRYFRVRIAPQGNTSNNDVLACVCLELYGYFRKRREAEGEGGKGLPLPVEAPILKKLGIELYHAKALATEWKDKVSEMFGLQPRKRKPASASKPDEKKAEAAKDRARDEPRRDEKAPSRKDAPRDPASARRERDEPRRHEQREPPRDSASSRRDRDGGNRDWDRRERERDGGNRDRDRETRDRRDRYDGGDRDERRRDHDGGYRDRDRRERHEGKDRGGDRDERRYDRDWRGDARNDTSRRSSGAGRRDSGRQRR
eukprot:TRINITY_DN5725_c0_g3_i1.p1 TRINITY_DN5725_c0_g3~~TRINITY_DN5725_c0_g3_i1.p1  ORF type:complete len:661 (+),score=183.34 TRINITY_DN5725_c0_g3_i1:82-1983(+)